MTQEQSPKWVVIELSHVGERECPETLEKSLRRMLGETVEIFIPALIYTRRGRTITMDRVEGYIFVTAELPSGCYFDLEDSEYFKSVLSIGKDEDRTLHYTSNREIEKIKRSLQRMIPDDFKVGDQVVVVQGVYTNLKGKILDIEEDRAEVHIEGLKSLVTIVTLPLVFLQK